MSEPWTCPICGAENDDNWPLVVDEKVFEGACQACWERVTSKEWWDMMTAKYGED
jgi:hypothetical protein